MELIGLVSLIGFIIIVFNTNTSTRENTQNAIDMVKGLMIRVPVMILIIGGIMYLAYMSVNVLMPEPVTPSITNQLISEIRPKIFNSMFIFAISYVVILESIFLISLFFLKEKLSKFKKVA